MCIYIKHKMCISVKSQCPWIVALHKIMITMTATINTLTNQLLQKDERFENKCSLNLKFMSIINGLSKEYDPASLSRIKHAKNEGLMCDTSVTCCEYVITRQILWNGCGVHLEDQSKTFKSEKQGCRFG